MQHTIRGVHTSVFACLAITGVVVLALVGCAQPVAESTDDDSDSGDTQTADAGGPTAFGVPGSQPNNPGPANPGVGNPNGAGNAGVGNPDVPGTGNQAGTTNPSNTESAFVPSGQVGFNIGDTAPDIEGEDIDGVPFKLSDYRGKVVVLDFWGHW